MLVLLLHNIPLGFIIFYCFALQSIHCFRYYLYIDLATNRLFTHYEDIHGSNLATFFIITYNFTQQPSQYFHYYLCIDLAIYRLLSYY
jgi:hypothetical protein